MVPAIQRNRSIWFNDAVERISIQQRRQALALNHCLGRPVDAVEDAAASVVGFHASDPATVYLSAWARVDKFEDTLLETALYEDRTLARSLGMRRTMFVTPLDLAGVIDASCAKDLGAAERRKLERLVHEQLDVPHAAAWLRSVEASVLEALSALGPSTAAELTAVVPDLGHKLQFGQGTKWQGVMGISTRVLFLLATDARIVRGRPRGTWRSSLYEWAITDTWFENGLPEIDKEPAETDLIRRWLSAYGPGTFTDVQWWTGWTKGKTRAVIERVAPREVDIDGDTGFVTDWHSTNAADVPDTWVALLPGLDVAIMGWKQREWTMGDHAPRLFDRNGNVGPTVWAGGRVVGGWAQSTNGSILIELLEDVGREAQAAIESKAAELSSWLGDHRVVPRFRTPLERDLTAR